MQFTFYAYESDINANVTNVYIDNFVVTDS